MWFVWLLFVFCALLPLWWILGLAALGYRVTEKTLWEHMRPNEMRHLLYNHGVGREYGRKKWHYRWALRRLALRRRRLRCNSVG